MIRRSKLHVLFTAAVLVLLSAWVPAAAQEWDTARLDKALETVRKWTYGQNAGDLQYVGGVVVQAGNTPAMRKPVERRLIAALKADGTKEGKAFLCRQLVIVGTAESIPALAAMLGDKDLSHMARYALERIEGPAACDAMREALPKVDDQRKIGLMHSLGRRRDEKAVDELVQYAGGANQDVAAAALTGLGLISSDQAIAAVAKARAGAADKKRKQVATQAYLTCAQGLVARGQKDKAAAIYRELLGPTETAMTRIASLQGLAAVLGGKGLATVIEALGDKDSRVRQAAIPCLRDVPGAEATKAIADMIPRQKPPVQKLLILVLIDRGDASALPAVVRATKAEDESVRIAAIEALGRLGDASVAAALAERAAGGGKEQPVARISLQQLKGKGVNAALIAQLGKADAKVRVEVIRALGARGAAESIDALLKQSGDEDPAIRAEVSRVLRSLAGAAHMPALVQLLVQAKPGRERDEAERSVVAIAKQIPPEKGPGKAVLAAMAKTQGEAKCSLIRVLGKIGDDATLDAVKAARSDPDAKVCDASLRALAGWPTAAPAATLKRLITDAKTDTHRILALRGYIEMIALRTDLEDEQQLVAAYAAAMAMAKRPQEKSLVLSKLAGVRHTSAIDLARKSMDDPKLKSAAAAAIKGIGKALKQPPRSFASIGEKEVRLATDGNKNTRWTTGTPMRGGEWFVLSLGQTKRVTGLIVDATGSNGDYPRGYEIYVSLSRSTWGRAVAKGKATKPRLDVNFPPKMGRYVKIVQTGRAEGNFWSIHHIEAKTKPK